MYAVDEKSQKYVVIKVIDTTALEKEKLKRQQGFKLGGLQNI